MNIEHVNLTLENAIDKIARHLNRIGEDIVPINQATNMVSAQNIRAAINVPPFPRSRVDGYAISKIDFFSNEPISLKVIDQIPAGDKNKYEILPGTSIKIMTGAPIPLNTKAIIKQEDVEVDGGNIKIKCYPRANSNIEFTGNMIQKGEVVAKQGQIFTPLLIEQLANTGVDRVNVFKKPKVYLINSGSELQLPGSPLEFGEIHNSNQSMWVSLFSLAGYEVICGDGQLVDDIDFICREIKDGLRVSDLVIITGGNSNGDWDLIPPALKKIGAHVIVAGLEMKPGNRTLVATHGQKLIFNISGNPHAGYILFQVLIKPVLNLWRGIKTPFNNWFDLKLYNEGNDAKNIRHFCRGALVTINNEFFAMQLRKNETDYSRIEAVNTQNIKFIAPLILDLPSSIEKKGDSIKGTLI